RHVTYEAAVPPGVHTLSLHDALPICAADDDVGAGLERLRAVVEVGRRLEVGLRVVVLLGVGVVGLVVAGQGDALQPLDRLEAVRSEEHTSELQSREKLVCRLLPEKKK